MNNNTSAIANDKKTTSVTISEIWDSVTSHPIVASALMCLVSMAIFLTGTSQSISDRGLLITFSVVAVATFAFVTVNGRRGGISTGVQCTIIGCVIFISFMYCWFMKKMVTNISFLFVAGGIVTILFAYWLYRKNRLNTGNIIAILFFMGFMLRLIYILYTTVAVRQHDVGIFGSGSGHSSYIEEIYNTFALPQGDVRLIWQHYHPPLHHILEAVWLHLITAFGVSFNNAIEGTQFLTMFYSMVSLVLSYKIFKFFKLKGVAIISAFAIIAFHPTFIVLSGSINNDMLSITFILGAILNTLYWYRKPTFGSIIKIALCIGLGMMTKLSVWMIAPGVAFVFLTVLIKNRHKIGKYLLQMLTFGCICVPLGLWWSIRNFLLFRVPFTYVPGLTIADPQYVGGYSVFQRLFDFNPSQFTSVFDQFVFYGGKYYEYNPTVGLLKTAMFDEANYVGVDILAKLLFWSGTVLAVMAVASMIYLLFKKTDVLDSAIKIFFTITYVIILASYYVFCFVFPHTCTENVRYIVPLIVLGAVYVGIAIKSLGGENKRLYHKVIKAVMVIIVAVFCVASVFLYNAFGSAAMIGYLKV
ncbi:MAG TPA: hypothetical protein GX401_05870 [Clostridiales bacterium]|nr:hypothetical protein [Clostridiales bacterium]